MKFVELRTEHAVAYVNPALVTYVAPHGEESCVIHFDNHPHISIGEPAAAVVRKLSEGWNARG